MKTKFILFGTLMFVSFFAFAENTLTIENMPSLITARGSHVQLVISANEFVVLGGHVNGFYLTKSVETYDGSTKQWTVTNSVGDRDMSFAAKLNNGNYLIGAGCSTGWGVGQLATTEIYNSTDKSFTAAASMNVPRTNATSATLKDGRVMVIGNWYASASTAEIYDPVTNSFTSTGACLVERSFPVIIPTDDGGAIVGGGYGIYGAQLGGLLFEKYNPLTNSFTEIQTSSFYNETNWTTTVGTALTHQYLLSSGKYALIIYKPDNSKVNIITIDPATEVIAEVPLKKVIPVNDAANQTIVFGTNTIPMIDRTRNLLHIIQAGLDASHILRIVTVNMTTGSVHLAKMNGFDYYPSSGNISMLDDGRILFIGGMKPDNFTLSDKAFIVSIPTYTDTGLDENNINDTIRAYWNSLQDAFILSSLVEKATLYDLNGKTILEKNNTNSVQFNSQSAGVYIIRVQLQHSNHYQLIKAIKY